MAFPFRFEALAPLRSPTAPAAFPPLLKSAIFPGSGVTRIDRHQPAIIFSHLERREEPHPPEVLASLRNYGAEWKRHAEPGSIPIKQNGGNLANFIFFTMNGRTYAFAYNHETEKIELRDRTQSSRRFTASTIRHQSPRSKLSSGTYKTMGQLASVRLQFGPGGVRRRFHRRLRSSLMFHLLSAR